MVGLPLPAKRGEGRGEGQGDATLRQLSWPLTLTLSPFTGRGNEVRS
jgi:hypothetical protein